MDIEQQKWEYLRLAKEIAQKWKSGELDDSNDESRAGGFWDMAMEIADIQLPDRLGIDDNNLELRDMVATIIYYSLMGCVLKD